MDPKKENPIAVARRFQWLSNDEILICSHWGFEKRLFITYEGLLEEVSSASVYGFT
jgi:hypothetical protein